MSIPAGSTRFALNFHYPQSESGETSFWTVGATIADEAAAIAAAASVADHLIETFGTLLAPMLPTGGAWDRVVAYHYDGGAAASVIGEAPIDVDGTGSGALPLQACAVATLQTGLSGRRNRGRMYWPVAGLGGSMAQSQLVQTPSDNLAIFTALLFRDVNDETAPELGTVSVVSRTATLAHAVTAVRADSRLDVQRRRAAQQVALFTKTQVVG